MTDSFTINEKTISSASPLSGMTTIEREKEEKKQEIQNIEEILATGQENRKKGIKATIEINKDLEQKKLAARNEILNGLDLKKEFDVSYKNALAKSLSDVLSLIEWMPGWTAEVVVTNGSPIQIRGKSYKTVPGILLLVFPSEGGMFHRAMTVTKDPALDYAMIYNMAMQTENTMDDTRKRLELLQEQKETEIVDKYGKSITPKSGAGN